MEGVIALLSITMMLAVLLFTCPLVGCSSAEAEQQAVEERPSRYEFVRDPCSTPFTSVLTVTDKETGQQWLVIYGSQGIAMQPIGGTE